jgi:hypothetical protein
MANNPYSPPVANVAERPEPSVAPGPMPLNVKIALVLLAAAELHGLYSIPLARLLEQLKTGEVSPVLVLSGLTGDALYITFIAFTFFRKNWARIAVAVLVCFGLIVMCINEYVYTRQTLPPGVIMKRDVLATLITIALLAARGGGAGLLFTRPANAWFRPRAAR